jgi:hypothetical protein
VSLMTGRPLIGAYVCPHGVFVVECRRSGGGVEITRTLDAPTLLESAIEAADQLNASLASAGIKGAELAVALRGFGVAYHVLQLPPAKDEMLSLIIERELRRLEPQMAASVVSWIPLPAFDAADTDAGPQRSVLAGSAPIDVVQAFERRLRTGGHQLLHVTALPAATQRLFEEFDNGLGSTSVIAPLPDGAFLGFVLNGGLRLIVEPPLPKDAEHEATVLAEEVELGVMFVRQQFHGAEIDRVTVIGSKDSLADAEATLSGRLGVPAERLAVPDLSAASLAALGAVLDAFSARPLAFAGSTRDRILAGPRTVVESISMAAVLLLAVLGIFTMTQAVRGRQVADELRLTQRRVEQDSFGLAPVRSTATQRKLVRDAAAALRLVADDRIVLQQLLTGIADVVRPPVRVDSLSLTRGDAGWLAMLAGSVSGETSGRAVQTLHDFYGQLPQRISADSLHLDQLVYPDTGAVDTGLAIVRFQLSFAIPIVSKD